MKKQLILITIITINTSLFAGKFCHTIAAATTGAITALTVENRKDLYNQVIKISKELINTAQEKLAQYENTTVKINEVINFEKNSTPNQDSVDLIADQEQDIEE